MHRRRHQALVAQRVLCDVAAGSSNQAVTAAAAEPVMARHATEAREGRVPVEPGAARTAAAPETRGALH